MCRRKPGPRCHSHASANLKTVRHRLKTARRQLARMKRKNAPARDIARTEARVDRLTHENYHRMRQYYSTPYARLKLERDELPQALRDMRHKELAVVRSEDEVARLEKEVSGKGGNTKANQDKLAAEQRKLASHREKLATAEQQYAIRAREVRLGEVRWEESKYNLGLQEKRDKHLEEGAFHRAQYSEKELEEQAESWERVGLTARGHQPKAKFHRALAVEGVRAYHSPAQKAATDERLVRHVDLETPTFEQVRGTFEVRVVKDARSGKWRVAANPKNMSVSIPKKVTRQELRTVGRSRLANWYQPPRNQDKEQQSQHRIASHAFDPTRTKNAPRGMEFETKQEAAKAAEEWMRSPKPAAAAAKLARNAGIQAQMSRKGFRSREQRENEMNRLWKEERQNQLAHSIQATLF